eukprot:1118231-Amphidinium_carterae.1
MTSNSGALQIFKGPKFMPCCQARHGTSGSGCAGCMSARHAAAGWATDSKLESLAQRVQKLSLKGQ